jgi:hypothetical protein
MATTLQQFNVNEQTKTYATPVAVQKKGKSEHSTNTYDQDLQLHFRLRAAGHSYCKQGTDHTDILL